MGKSLIELEPVIHILKTALDAGFELYYNKETESVKFKLPENIDKQSGRIIGSQLRQNKEIITRIVKDKKITARKLANVQDELAQAHKDLTHIWILWDDLLAILYTIFPDMKECIRGDDGCPDDAVQVCNVCSNTRKEELNNGK